MDNGASFNTQGVPRGVQVSKAKNYENEGKNSLGRFRIGHVFRRESKLKINVIKNFQ